MRRGWLAVLALAVACEGAAASVQAPVKTAFVPDETQPDDRSRPSASLALGNEARDSEASSVLALQEPVVGLWASPDRVALATTGEAIVGWTDGDTAWSKAGDFAGPLVLLGTTAVHLGPGTVDLFDIEDGGNWVELAVPMGPEAERDMPPRIVALAEDARVGTLLLSSDARLYVMDERACAERGAMCLSPAGYLFGEYLDAQVQFSVGPDGARILAEGERVRVFDRSLHRRADFEVGAPIEGVAPISSDLLALAITGDIVVVDLRCQERSSQRRLRSTCIRRRVTAGPRSTLRPLGGERTLVRGAAQSFVLDARGQTVWHRKHARVVALGLPGMWLTWSSHEHQARTLEVFGPGAAAALRTTSWGPTATPELELAAAGTDFVVVGAGRSLRWLETPVAQPTFVPGMSPRDRPAPTLARANERR